MGNQSYLGNGDVTAIDALYTQYRQDPTSVDVSWRRFFEGFEFQKSQFDELPGGSPSSGDSLDSNHEYKVMNLINGYRQRGHLFTKTNPVRERRKHIPTLDIEHFGLSQSDMDTVFHSGNEIGIGPATLREIIAHLEQCYCSHVGIEYMYVRDPERITWLRERLETKTPQLFTTEEKKEIFGMVSKSTLFEQYIQKRFVGQKRFSVEGCEAVIPAMQYIINEGGETGVKEFIIGMAHRGRLNVLTNIMGKPYHEVFTEFEGVEYDEDESFDGDVKYHYGYSASAVTHKGNKVHLTLCPNPSHLESVDSVVGGLARAKIDNYLKSEDSVVPIMVHGDAAIAAQGIVYEVIQMAQLNGYRTGGTIHIVTNNQVGFTTNYIDGRSSTYCTDIAKTTLCPVFHVNADDVEAVIRTMKIAFEYRMKFKRDVFVDLLGYRKYGHNEGDEPKFTQPTLYNLIAKHPALRDIYLKQLISQGTIDAEYGKQVKDVFEAQLDESFEASKQTHKTKVKHFLESTWSNYRKATEKDFEKSPNTSVDKKKLIDLAKKMSTLPAGEKFFRKTQRVFDDRLKMIEENNLDWGMGELLAYATLLDEKHPVRISGQDVERGTFSHRHAVVKTDEDQEKEFIPLNLMEKDQAKLSIYNSLLSEYGVLGYEYGYAFGSPNGLTIWEAQFGDFSNGGQIIIDQYISAAEDKWGTMNGLTMLLPHGYEGQGSEHSSGRLERYLQLCAELNIQVCNCTTPANYFHLLRRQVHTDYRKPLIVFTPKKLLRYPKAVSTFEDMAIGSFQEVIDDLSVSKKDVNAIVFCSGKLYYDILETKEKTGTGDDLAIVRLEQLYPLPDKQIRDLIQLYNKGVKLVWAQEEPENMGAWTYMLQALRDLNLEVVALPASASPATGSPIVHAKRTNDMLNKLFSYSKVKEKVK